MKARSAINKGNRAEEFVCKQIEEIGLGRARREIGSGNGHLKGDIFADIPFLLEIKNHKMVQCLSWIDQAKKQAEQGNDNPDKWALVFRDPRKPEFEQMYVTLDLWQFLRLLKKNKEPLIKEPDKQLKYDILHLKVVLNKILKQLP
jgi:hypothetical protein